jgi:predicted dehydrogenase
MKTCVVGAGHISQQHLACLRTLPGVEVVGVCDLSPALAEAVAERFGVGAWYTDHRKMLSEQEPDVVHIGTPPSTHHALTVDALEAGAHAFVEKPIATQLDDWASMRELAEDRGLLLIEDHNYLFNETIERIKRWIASGELGSVVHVDVTIHLDILGEGSRMVDPNLPHPSLSLPGGVIAEFLTHMAYLSHAFVGEHRSVRTLWSKRTQNTPLPSDEFRALIDAEGGTATLCFSAHAQPDCFLVQVQGTRMRAEAHLFEPRLVSERLLGDPRPLLPLRNGLRRSLEELRGGVGSLWRKLGGGPGAYEGQWELLRRTYESLQRGGPPPISLDQIDAVNRLVAELTDKGNRS